MLSSIPYRAVPETTPFNVAAFLLNYNDRKDELSIGEAFCKDFDTTPDIHLLKGCNATAFRMIVENYLS